MLRNTIRYYLEHAAILIWASNSRSITRKLYMQMKILIPSRGVKFEFLCFSLWTHPKAIWDHPWSGKHVRELKSITKTNQKWEKWENRAKHPKTSGNHHFQHLEIKFRSADAANRVNRSSNGAKHSPCPFSSHLFPRIHHLSRKIASEPVQRVSV